MKGLCGAYTTLHVFGLYSPGLRPVSVSTCRALCRPSDVLHGGGLTEIQPPQRQRLTGAFLTVCEGMKKPALYSGFEQVTAGASMLPKVDDAAALGVLYPRQIITGDFRAAHIIPLGTVVYDGVG